MQRTGTHLTIQHTQDIITSYKEAILNYKLVLSLNLIYLIKSINDNYFELTPIKN